MKILYSLAILLITVGCKVKKDQPKAETSSQTESKTYTYTVSFYSPGDGIDVETFRKYKAFVESYKPSIEHTISAWGREGEKDVCMNLSSLSDSERADFIKASEVITSTSKKVNIHEDGKCHSVK